MKTKAAQESIADYLARDIRPVHEWAQSMGRLPPCVYEQDAQLSRRMESFIRDITSSAANLDCIGTDDPTAPPVGSSTRAVLAYMFRRRPERAAEFKKLIARADQLLGRRTLLHLMEPVVN